MESQNTMPTTDTAKESKVLFTEEGHKLIGEMLDMLAGERGFVDKEEGVVFTDEQGLKMLLKKQCGPLSIEQCDKIEALFDYTITRANRNFDVDGIMIFIPTFDHLWYILKKAREKAGRPKPKLT